MKRRRLLHSQGWVESTAGELRALRDAILSDQPETTIGIEGEVKVRRLEPFPPAPEVERTNVSGEASITPVGSVRRKR